MERVLRSRQELIEAIQTLSVRGAPAIGICAAFGLAARAQEYADNGLPTWHTALREDAEHVRRARPTAVNLAWAVDRMLATLTAPVDARAAARILRDEANAIANEDEACCRAIGEHGLGLVPNGARVLTHCNAGALATGGMGTALAPVYLATERGRVVHVWVDETRPLLQGSRLTMWELQHANVPATLVADNMAASLMRKGAIDLCLVGADRVAANGDVVNKIGTYGVAVLAAHHGIPFFVAAPSSSIDVHTAYGDDIAIEHRDQRELTSWGDREIAPTGVRAYNPAFDVTPASLVSGILTERGLFRAPYDFHDT